MSFLVNSSFGADDPERATVPFILACSAANKAKTKVFLTGHALGLVLKGRNEHVAAEGYTPVRSYVEEFVGKGGEIIICRVCANVMGVTEEDLIDGVAIGGAPDTMAFLEAGAKLLH
jgi:predicted peroxiredoxin